MIRSNSRAFRLCALASAMLLCFAPACLAASVNSSALKSGGRYDRLIVRFHSNSAERRDPAARQRALDAAGNGLVIRQLRRLAVGADVIKLDRKLGTVATEQLMQRIASNPRVEYVELDAIRKPILVPNDTFYASNQWHYFEATAGINMPAAWGKATGTGTVVAVIDTGITPHSDLAANIITGFDFISDPAFAGDGNGRDADPNDVGDSTIDDQCAPGEPGSSSSWHGTHVAGTVAAVTNNAKGVAGVAFNAKVSPLRALGKCGGFTSDIADAIVWAAGGAVGGVPANANPAEVINMSLGGAGTCDATTQSAINSAVAAGTVVVVAAGNDDADASGFSPASCANVITVGAIGRAGARSSYSNFGSAVDVAAPGGDGPDSVVSTINTGTTVQVAEDYAGYQGTSMASPHVAGTVALMQSVHPTTPAVVEGILKNTSRTLPVPCPEGCGSGIIDASMAITGAINPTLTIADVILAEGNSGTKLATFTVKLSRPAATTVTYNIATSNGTAAAGSDYVASSLTGQSIAAGATSKTFSVTINGDAAVEGDETFFVDVSSVVGVAVGDPRAQGKILNDEVPMLTNKVAVASLSAATGGQLLFGFTVPAGATGLRFDTTGGTGDVDLYVKRGSAPTTSVADCSSLTNTNVESCVISAPGVVATSGTYFVLLDAFAAFSGVSLTGQYVPGLAIADVAVVEGNAGSKLMTFTVKLASASASPVTYDIATVSGSATAGTDFVASTLLGQSIAAGVTSKTFSVTQNGDAAIEANEAFSVVLSNVSGAGVTDGTAIGTILNDDGPTLSIADVAISEGNSGTKLATFTVKLSQASASAVTYNIATANGTAASPGDFVASSLSGQTIAAGLTSKTFTVTINGDAVAEQNETFVVNLAGAVGATVVDSQAVGTILNDEGLTLSVGDVAISEGNAGTKLATFTVQLSGPSASAVSYSIATANGTAVAPGDFIASALTGQSIAGGLTSKTFSVTLNGDATVEANETFLVNLSAAVGATILDSQAVGTIINDDGPTLSIADVALTEGNSGTKLATFTVTLSPAAATAVTYNIATASSTAAAPSDYITSVLSGQSIAAGATSKTFSVTINGDTTIEPNETFLVNLAGAVGATIADSQAQGRINNDD